MASTTALTCSVIVSVGSMQCAMYEDENIQYEYDDETMRLVEKSMLVSVKAFKRAKRRPTKSVVIVAVVANVAAFVQ